MVNSSNSSFWHKNKWYIVFFVVVAGLSIYIGLRQVFVSSGAYELAIKSATENKYLEAHLGRPIKPAFIVGGEIFLAGSGFVAKLKIPLSGPNGKTLLKGKAKKVGGKWVFDRLVVVLDKGKEVDLLLNHSPTR